MGICHPKSRRCVPHSPLAKEEAADHFRPGSKTFLDLGFRYNATDTLGLLIQVNPQFRETDSVGRSVFLSPGLAYAITRDVQVYGFYQWAAYQYVNGVQLTARSTSVLGGSLRF